MAQRSHWSTIAKAIQSKTGGTWKDAVTTYRAVRNERGSSLSLHYLRTTPARVILKDAKKSKQPIVSGEKPQPLKPQPRKVEFLPPPPIRDKWIPPSVPLDWRKYKSNPLVKYELSVLKTIEGTALALAVSLAQTTIGRDLKLLPSSYTVRMGKLMIEIGRALEKRGFIPDRLRRKLAALIISMGRKLNKPYTDNEFYQGMRSFYG